MGTELLAGAVRASSLRNTLIYITLMREEVGVLRDVRGGDRLRLACLVHGLGVKLVGRQGLEPTTYCGISGSRTGATVNLPSRATTPHTRTHFRRT